MGKSQGGDGGRLPKRAEAVGRVRPQLQWEDCGRVMRKVEEDVLTSS